MYLLFVLGAVWWSWFFYFGQISTAVFDFGWFASYRGVLSDALIAHELPLYRAQHAGVPWFPWDNRVAEYLYWAHPQTPLLPHVFLARAPFSWYVIVPLLIFYAIGCAGIMQLVRRYHLAFGPAALLFVLCMFNGHLMAHMGVWHSWEGAFFTPWLIYYTCVAIEERPTTQHAIGLGVLLTLIVYQGQMHVLVYDVLFLGLLALAVPSRAWWVTKVGLVIGTLGCARLLPTFFIFPFGEPAAQNMYFAAFEPPYRVLEAFVSRDALYHYQNWWEYEMYVGWAALALTPFALYGLVRWYYRVLPVLLLLFTWCYAWDVVVLPGTFGIGMVRFDWWHWLHIPLLSTERVPTRLLLLPTLFAVFAGCRALNTGWGKHVALVIVVCTIPFLHMHADLYRSTFVPGIYKPAPVGSLLLMNPPSPQVYVADAPGMAPPRTIAYDTVLYRRTIGVGLGISLLSILGWILIYARERT